MDEIRRALGEDKISYFGFSYGSQLGATYATMFPTHVRAMVIDGAADPNAGYVESTKQQVVGLERGLQQMMDDCAKKTTCAFHHDGNPMAGLRRADGQAGRQPAAVGRAAGRPVGPGIALYGVVSGLYVKEYWPLVTQALAAAERGDGSKLLALYDAYVERLPNGTWTQLVRGPDRHQLPRRPGPQGSVVPRQLRRRAAHAVAPLRRLGRLQLQLHLLARAAEAADEDHRGRRRPHRGGRHDGRPDHAHREHEEHGRALEDGVLVTVEAEQHTGYMVNDCVDTAVDDYLIDLTVPAAGLVCLSYAARRVVARPVTRCARTVG